MSKSKVICIGEALIDQIINQSTGDYTNYLGGAPANVACMLGNLHVDTNFIGCIGQDKYGESFIEQFTKLKINLNFLQFNKNFPTRIVKVEKNKEGDRVFVGFQDDINISFADEMLDLHELRNNIHNLEEIYRQTKYIVTGTLCLSAIKTSESMSFLLNYAKQFNIQIIIDLNWRDIFWDHSLSTKHKTRTEQKHIILDFLFYADILKLSKEEALLFFQTSDPLIISKVLPKQPSVIITDGAQPILWYFAGHIGTTNISTAGQIVDTTGAGDAFLGGLISQLLNFNEVVSKEKIEKAINYASACGFLNCLGQGAIENLPDNEKIQTFLKSNGL